MVRLCWINLATDLARNAIVLCSIGFALLAPDAEAALITQGYGTQHIFRDCTNPERNCITRNLDFLDTSEYRFSLDGVRETDPTGFFFDDGDDSSARGLARSEALAPGSISNYPLLKASASSTAGSRVSSVVTSFQAYTNTTDSPLALQLDASVDGTVMLADEPWTETVDGVTTSENSFVFSTVSVFTTTRAFFDTTESDELEIEDPESIPGLDVFRGARCTNQLVTGVDFGCGVDPTVEFLFTSSVLAQDDGVFDLAFDRPSESVLLAPGERIFLGGFLSAIGLNGGAADAFNTFSATFVDPATGEVVSAERGLKPISTVPESSSWVLVLLAITILAFRSKFAVGR